MMTDLNKVFKVALVALTMMVGAQGASADAVTSVVESSRAPFGFATRSSRTDASSTYDITGGGAYTVDAIKAMMTTGGIAEGSGGSATVDGKKIIVLVSDGTSDKASAILDAITNNDIIVFDGSGTSTDFQVYAQITLRNLSGKTLLGINGARLCTRWHMTDVIKSWLNAVETSSGSGVSNASTASGTGGSFWLKNIAGEDSLEITIDEEGEWLTRMTLANKGQKLFEDWRDDGYEGEEPENSYFLRTERYRKSGIFYIEGCENVIIRNISFVGPGSVDVGGVDLISAINGTNHVWVDHCEFIDGQDGNFDITNYSDYITVSWCHFHYTDRSYVHQNTNLVGSGDDKARNTSATGDAYNEWGENCRSRMPMGRAGKIHMLNNWYNCAGNTENAINPRLNSEYLVEGNYFATGVTKTFKAASAVGVSVSDNTTADASATKLEASGSAVTVPYTYAKLSSVYVPDSVELLVGPVLDKVPTYTFNPVNDAESAEYTDDTHYNLNTNSARAAQGLTFSVWANYTMSWQWYMATEADLSDAVAIDGATLNSYTYTFSGNSDTTIYLYCVATGLAGSVRSNIIKVVITYLDVPEFTTDLSDTYTALKDVGTTLTVATTGSANFTWYKNSSASTEGATQVTTSGIYTVDGASLTVVPTESELDTPGSEYFYCVAANAEDPTLVTRSNITHVKYISQQTLIDWEADATTPVAGDADLAGIEIGGTTAYATVKYKTNSIDLGTIQLKNGYLTEGVYNGNSIKLTVAGGFQVGDVITLAGFISNVDAKKNARAALFVLNEDGTYKEILYEPGESYINGRLVDDNPVEYTYTVKASDISETDGSIYIGREGGTNVNMTLIKVTRGDPTKPHITTDLNASYEATATRSLELTVEAEDATSYVWYSCSGTGSYETGKARLDSLTTNTYSYTPAAAGTYYIYCVATNGSGDKIKRDTTRIATIVAAATPVGTATTVTYTAIKDDAENSTLKEGGSGASSPAGYIYSATVGISGNISWIGTGSWSSYTDGTTQYSPVATSATGTVNDYMCYTITPVSGYAFIPSTLSFGAMRNGTDAGTMTVKVNDQTIASGVTVGRRSKAGTFSFEYDLSSLLSLESDITNDNPLVIQISMPGIGSGKQWGMSGLTVTGLCREIVVTNVSKPEAAKGAESSWIAASERWPYTITCGDNAEVNYILGSADKVTAQASGTVVNVAPDEVLKIWASPKAGVELDESDTVRVVGAAMPQVAAPTFTVSSYNLANKGFKVTIKGTTGATLHYTTDGTDPIVGTSSVYSKNFYVDPETTIKAVATLNHYATSDQSSIQTVALSRPTGSEVISYKNAEGQTSGKPVPGASYTMHKNFNKGKPNTFSDGLKINPLAPKANSYFQTLALDSCIEIPVNAGFVVDSLIFEATNNYDPASNVKYSATATSVYVRGSSTPVSSPNMTFDNYYKASTPVTKSFKVNDLNASDTICIGFETGGSAQLNTHITLYYHVADAPAKVTVNSVDSLMSTFKENVLTIDPAKITYDENPTMTLVTTNGYEYAMNIVTGDGDGYTKYASPTFENNTIYYVKVKVRSIAAPLIAIDEDLSLVKPDDDHITSGAAINGGYKVTLTDIADGTTPYIIIDSDIDDTNARAYKAVAQRYYPDKEYYALKSVRTFCSYPDEENPSETDSTSVRYMACPDNTYDKTKPFAVYLYVDGYADTGTGQEKGTIASSFDPSTDKIHLGLADQFNVLDYHKASVNEKMVNEAFPDITNAKLVVISEMIGSGSATSGSVYESSGASNFSMSLRDSLINHTNVLNLKMFFYSQSKNNTQRWAWAQPTTLTNSVVSIVPTNAMYKVFEDVAFSKDGSLALWSGFDEESTLNRLQLVHNYNEANEDLPEFTLLATATDLDGEEYDALHFFEKDGYTYVGTGISINDNANYDDNLRYLVSTIGSMIKSGTSLGTTLGSLPAPRIKDNGDGSATITNNNASAVTYYKTSASADETWSAETIKADNNTTYESVTDKFNSDVYVYAISDVSGTLSGVAKAEVAGSTTRYFHRTNADAEAEGLESSVPFTAETATITIPYNQSFRKAGYTVTQWKDKKTGTLYTPGASFSTTTSSQDLYLEAVWTANTKKITDLSAETEAQRTVTWNFLQTDGAPALSLEYGSTKVAQQGFIVGQAKFSDGTFIDVAMYIDADNTTTIPGSSTEYTGKFNNKQNVLSDATKYIGAPIAHTSSGE